MKTKDKFVVKYKLYIDTSSEKAILAIFNHDMKIIEKSSWNCSGDLSDVLLSNISKILKNNFLDLSMINLIVVNAGPGSYTGLRIGISTVNAISWARGIEVRHGALEDGKLKIFESAKPIFIMPKYDNPPKITVSKKK